MPVSYTHLDVYKRQGLPAACFAMYQTALPKNKQKVKGMLLAAGLTSFFTGITAVSYTHLDVYKRQL